SDQGLKQVGLAPGPDTIFGPAQAVTADNEENRKLAQASPARRRSVHFMVVPPERFWFPTPSSCREWDSRALIGLPWHARRDAHKPNESSNRKSRDESHRGDIERRGSDVVWSSRGNGHCRSRSPLQGLLCGSCARRAPVVGGSLG